MEFQRYDRKTQQVETILTVRDKSAQIKRQFAIYGNRIFYWSQWDHQPGTLQIHNWVAGATDVMKGMTVGDYLQIHGGYLGCISKTALKRYDAVRQRVSDTILLETGRMLKKPVASDMYFVWIESEPYTEGSYQGQKKGPAIKVYQFKTGETWSIEGKELGDPAQILGLDGHKLMIRTRTAHFWVLDLQKKTYRPGAMAEKDKFLSVDKLT